VKAIAAAAVLIVTAAVGAGFAPGVARASPPVNDNYLDSLRVNAPGSRLPRDDVKDVQNTLEATTQTDLFAPKATGGGAEPTDCNGASFGKTIWYDFYPDLPGTAEVQTAGFDAVVTVYEFDRTMSRIVRAVGCSSAPGVTEDLFVDVEAGKSYTVQIGGAVTPMGPAGGELQLTLEFFADRDGDGVFDPLDDCPDERGQGSSGCPPVLRAAPKLRARPRSDGILVESLRVTAPRGARVALRCRRGCAARQVRRSKSGAVTFDALRGALLPAGATFDIIVTKPLAVGSVFRYLVTHGNFKRTDRCLKPGSLHPRRRCD